jgi:hypothetical protein
MACRLTYYLCEATSEGVPIMSIVDEPFYDEDDPEEILAVYHAAFHPTRFTYLIEEIPVIYLLAKRTVTVDHLAASACLGEEIGACRIIEVTEEDADLQRLYLEKFEELASPQTYDEIAEARSHGVARSAAA